MIEVLCVLRLQVERLKSKRRCRALMKCVSFVHSYEELQLCVDHPHSSLEQAFIDESPGEYSELRVPGEETALG